MTTLVGHLTTVPHGVVLARREVDRDGWQRRFGTDVGVPVRRPAGQPSRAHGRGSRARRSTRPAARRLSPRATTGRPGSGTPSSIRRCSCFGQIGGSVRALAYSPDGKLLASAGGDGTLRLWNVAATVASLRAIRSGTPLDGVAFSPDGRLVAAAGKGVAQIWRVDGAPSRVADASPARRMPSPSRPTARHLAIAGQDGVARIRLAHRRTRASSSSPRRRGQRRRVQPATATASRRPVTDGLIRLWTPTDGWSDSYRAPQRLSPPSPSVADGKLLVSGSGDHDIRIWSVATGTTVRRLNGPVATVNDVAFSSDGRWVVDAGPASGRRVVGERQRAPRRPAVLPLRGHDSRSARLPFAPNGWRIAAAERRRRRSGPTSASSASARRAWPSRPPSASPTSSRAVSSAS